MADALLEQTELIAATYFVYALRADVGAHLGHAAQQEISAAWRALYQDGSARASANALEAVWRAKSVAEPNARRYLRSRVERAVRDVVVVRCVNASTTPGDRQAFLRACKDALGVEHLEHNLNSDLLRARSKVFHVEPARRVRVPRVGDMRVEE